MSAANKESIIKKDESPNGPTNTNNLLPNDSPKKKDKRYHGPLLVALIFVVIISIYYIYVIEVMYKGIKDNNIILIITLIVFFHIILILLLMAFIKTMRMQPGSIPLYWGFYIGDDDYKRKRYCLICNAFKPERSHHCSICNTCVLNMDHHCPWVHNCIGFYNRKFFMQLLFYVVMLAYYIDFSLAYFVYDIIIEIALKKNFMTDFLIHAGIILPVYCFVIGFTVVISIFFKFHLQLVLTNSTTIENLDKEHIKENEKFNISPIVNWKQVFGNNVVLWFIPLDLDSGKPVGDGLNWKTRDEPDGDELMKSGNNNDIISGATRPGPEKFPDIKENKDFGSNQPIYNYDTNQHPPES